MALLTSNDEGTLAFVSASAGGDRFENNGRKKVLVKNEDAVEHTATITAQKECSQGYLHNKEYIVAVDETILIDNLAPRYYNDENNLVQMSYDSETGMSISVLNM